MDEVINNVTSWPRFYLQTIVVIVILAGVIYLTTQSLLDRGVFNDAADAAKVSQAILAGGEVSEEILLAQLSSVRLENLKSQGVISCAGDACFVDAGVLVIAQNAVDAALEAKAAVKTIFANLLTTLNQGGNVVFRADIDGDPETIEAVVGFKGGLEAGTVKAFDESGVELWAFNTFRRYQSAPVQTSNDVTSMKAADLLGDGDVKLAVLSTDQRFFPSRITVINTDGTIASTELGDIDYYHPGKLEQMELFTGPDTRQFVFVGNSNALPYITMWQQLEDLDLDGDGTPGESVMTQVNLARVAFGIDPANMIGQAPPGVEVDVPVGQPAWYMAALPWGSQVVNISELDGSIALSHSCGYTFKLNSAGRIVEAPLKHTVTDPNCDGKLVGFLRFLPPEFLRTQLAEFSLIQTSESDQPASDQ